ncbi:hypothetical protein PoB_005267000 [Plakobranchus ocellatus]|uniref:Uncharacterized protein n=1 Tax=Plakobranchus ocellatus TaxID=259542 RepID=A0AAV4C3G6_9GAST|nr:hypothetical protein PoB_005267000 [Plakobranchus ocellatus]
MNGSRHNAGHYCAGPSLIPGHQWRGSNSRQKGSCIGQAGSLLSPGLAIDLVTKINYVGSTAKSIVFAPKHPALPGPPACDCDDQL